MNRMTPYRTILNSGLFLIFFITVSCDTFLDEIPDNRVSLNDLDKAAQLVTNAYSIASPAFTDLMTDNAFFIRGVNIRPEQQELFEWKDISRGPDLQDTPEFYWYATYDAIAHANEVLAVINDIPIENEQDELRKDAIRGEAFLARAYAHFMLVNLFGQDVTIDPGEPGIPYVKTPETKFIQKYERASVRRVYQEIEDDLEKGLSLINDNFFLGSGKYHFTRNAALAFASRYYLFTQDFSKCVQYSNQLLGSDAAPFIRDLTSDQFQVAKSSIQGYPQLYTSPDLPSNILLMRKISFVHIPSLGPGPDESFYGSLYASHPFEGATDERENPAFVKGDNGLLPVRYQNLFERSSLNSNVGIPYHIAPSLTGEEVLLNRIEANTYLGNTQAALADLQLLSNRRYTGPDTELTFEKLKAFFGATNEPSFTDQLALLNYVLLERRKEFIIHGMRWFDIKRYGITVNHTLQNGSVVTLESDDVRKILQIPESAQEVGGLKPNDR